MRNVLVKEDKQAAVLSVLAVILLAAAGCSPTVSANVQTIPEAANSLPLEVSAEEAYQLVEEGSFLLDVRTQEEWDEYHVSQAVLIPIEEIASRLDEVPQDQTVVVICRSGNRSAAARDFLLSEGFTTVTSSAGGMKAWAAAGYPVEGSAP